MDEIKSGGNRRNYLRILPGLLISLTALIIIMVIVDWQEVQNALRQAEYKYLLVGIPVYLIAYSFRALAWRTLLLDEVPFTKVFLTMQAGYLLNNILPFRLGEVGRAFIMGRSGPGFWRVVSTIIIERAFDLVLAVGLLLGTIPFVFGSSQHSRAAYIVGSIVVLGTMVLHLLARNKTWALDKFNILTTRFSMLSRFGSERLNAFFEGLSALVQVKRFFRVLVFMVASLGLALIYQYTVLQAFDVEVKFLWAAFGFAAVSLGVAVPSSPSYIGILEAAWIGALSLFDVPSSTALAYAITVHIIHIVISILFGGYALMREGETLGDLYANLRNRRF